MKMCSKCRKEKDEGEFYSASKKKKDGSQRLRSICKKCTNENSIFYQKKNPEKTREKARKHYSRKSEVICKKLREKRKLLTPFEKDRVSAQQALYRRKNKDVLREKRREKYDSDIQSIKWKEYYENNRKALLRQKKEYRSHLDDEQRELCRQHIRRWQKKNPEKVTAHKKLYYAIKKGYILRPTECSKCKANCKIDAHHADYSKPLEVIWLCRGCHAKEHKKKD